MKGNALQPDNRLRINQAKKILESLKEIKLMARATKYQHQSADFSNLVEHLIGEANELTWEIEKRSSCLAIALEVADISNCCDLIIAELLESLTEYIMTDYS